MQQPEKQTDLSLLEEMGYEPQDVDVKHMPVHAIALFVSILVVLGLSYLIMLVINPDSVGRRDAEQFRSMPEEPNPLLQTNVTAQLDMVQLREREHEVMHGYGWSDLEGGKAHVPVDRAMEMVLEEGLPTRGSEPAMTPDPETKPHTDPMESGDDHGAADPAHEEPTHEEPPHEEAGH